MASSSAINSITSPTVRFHDVPPELHEQIFIYLLPTSMQVARATCRHWNHVIFDMVNRRFIAIQSFSKFLGESINTGKNPLQKSSLLNIGNDNKTIGSINLFFMKSIPSLKEKIVSILKQLSAEDLVYLQKLSNTTQIPESFEDVFSLALLSGIEDFSKELAKDETEDDWCSYESQLMDNVVALANLGYLDKALEIAYSYPKRYLVATSLYIGICKAFVKNDRLEQALEIANPRQDKLKILWEISETLKKIGNFDKASEIANYVRLEEQKKYEAIKEAISRNPNLN